MSITYENGCRELLVEAMRWSGKPLPELRICEFGCQRIKTGPDSNMRRLQSSRSVLMFLGAEVISIDLNGHMGSLSLDLGKPLTNQFVVIADYEEGRRKWPQPSDIGSFDLVTDFGTIEHVQHQQAWAFRNLHDLCRVGGLMVHALPHSPSRHGVWSYTAEWFQHLAACNRYGVIRCERWFKRDTVAGEEHYVRAIFRKVNDAPFAADSFVHPEKSLR